MQYRYDIFVSYSSEDRKLVTDIVSHLEQGGFSTYVDSRDIKARTNWREAIHQAITASRIVVVVATQNGLNSPMVQEERDLAHRQNKDLVIRPAARQQNNANQDLTVNDEEDETEWAEQIMSFLEENSPPKLALSEHFVLAEISEDQAPTFEALDLFQIPSLPVDTLPQDDRAVILVVTGQVERFFISNPGSVGKLISTANASLKTVHVLFDGRRRKLPLGLRLRQSVVLTNKRQKNIENVLDELLFGPPPGASKAAVLPLKLAVPTDIYVESEPTRARKGGSATAKSFEYRRLDGALMSEMTDGDYPDGRRLLDQTLVTQEQWCAFLNCLQAIHVAELRVVDNVTVCVHEPSGLWLGVDVASYNNTHAQLSTRRWDQRGPVVSGEVWEPSHEDEKGSPATMMTWWGAAAYSTWVSGESMTGRTAAFEPGYLPTVDDLKIAGSTQQSKTCAIDSEDRELQTEVDWIGEYGDGRRALRSSPSDVDKHMAGDRDRPWYSVVGNVAEWCAASRVRGAIHTPELRPVFGGSFRSPAAHCEVERGASLISAWSFAADRGFRCRIRTPAAGGS